MKVRLLLALVGLAISLPFPTFAQQKDTVDPKIIEQLREEDKNFEEAYNKHDAAALAAFYTAIKRSRLESKPACGHSRCVKNWRWPRVNSGTLICAENKS